MAIHRYPSNHVEWAGSAHSESSSDCPCVSIDIPEAFDPLGEKFFERLPERGPGMRCVVRRGRSSGSGGCLDLYVEDGNIYLLTARKSGRDWHVAEIRTLSRSCRTRSGRARTCPP